MRLKSYFAATVESAIGLARQELGPEAMLVESRRTGIETRHLGEYEVICASVPPTFEAAADGAGPTAAATGVSGAVRAPVLDKLSQEVAELKRCMEQMAATMARTGTGFANIRSNPHLAEAFALLTSADVDSKLAYDLVTAIGDRLEEGSDPRRLMLAEISQLLSIDARLGRNGASRSIAALVGPPGCGKTSCLVKLAIQYGLANRRPTQILSIDTYRVSAAEQLRSYATILGVGFQVLETVAALAQALEEHRNKGLVLIDTPGFGKRDLAESEDLAHFLATHPDIDTHLVLPASVKGADLKRMIEGFQNFRPAKLLFTRLDETETFGSILNVAAMVRKPVSFLSWGQQIPEDLEPAAKESLVGLILRKPSFEDNMNSAVAAA